MGLVGSFILAVVPSILADQHGDMRPVALSEANVIASLVSAAAPMLIGWFAPTVLGWRTALIVAVLAVLGMRTSFGRVNLSPAPVSVEPNPTRQRLPPLYWFYWVALVLAVSVEFCMVFWSADYLETGLGMPKASAAQAVSLFLGGMIAGRLVSSRLVQRFSAQRVITGSLVIAAVGFLIYWTASSPLFGMTGLFVTGLGVACLYPLILSLTIGSASRNSDQAGALASLASGVAILSLPLILGRLADEVGIRAAYAIIILLLTLELAIILGTTRFARLKPIHQGEHQ
jgi:predicted MFS family arabinose efflux permease